MLPRRLTAALGLAAVLLLPHPGAAQPDALTLDEALSLARQRAPELQAATARLAEAQGALTGASPLLRHNPVLEGEAGPREEGDGGRGVDVAVGLSQTVELGGKRRARLEGARAGVDRESARQRDTGRRVLGEVAASFLRALHARERLALAHEVAATAADTLRTAQRRHEAGDVPVMDVHVARLALARARAEVASTEGEEAARLGQLRELLGLEPDAPLGVRGDLGALALTPFAPTPDTSMRPDVVLLEAELEEARAEGRLAASGTWPDVDVGVRYEREGDERAVHGLLSVPLPLFAREQGGRAVSAARVRRLEGELAALRRTQQTQAAAARSQHAKNLEALQLLQREALPLVEENARLARRAYEAGEMGLPDFLFLRRETLEARAAYLDRLLDAALSRAHVAVQTGVFR